MKAYWTDAKPDGSKITDGRLCRIVDAEDGSLPVRVYGRTEQEVFDKIERTMMTAQMRLTQERGATTPQRNAPHAPVAPAADPAILSADEIMRLTQEQQNPAKSAEANARLADHHRALQRKELTDFAQVCERWQRRHPELVDSLFNKKLITDNARMRSGSLKAISEEVLEQVYQELQAGGYLLTEESAALHNEEPITPTVPPAGRQEPVPVRPTGGVVSATSHRSNRLSAPQAPRWQPKYTMEQINKLTTKETEALNRPTHPGHKDYVEACDFWFAPKQVTA